MPCNGHILCFVVGMRTVKKLHCSLQNKTTAFLRFGKILRTFTRTADPLSLVVIALLFRQQRDCVFSLDVLCSAEMLCTETFRWCSTWEHCFSGVAFVCLQQGFYIQFQAEMHPVTHKKKQYTVDKSL